MVKKYKNILLYVLIFSLLFPIFLEPYIAYGNEGIEKKKVRIEKKDNNKQFAVIKTSGAVSTAGIRYWVDGWYITANFGGETFPKSASGYYKDSQTQMGNDWVSEIPLSVHVGNNEPLYEYLNIPDEYYRMGGTITFNAAIKIRYNGVLTEPVYGTFSEINNAVRERYGVPWSSGGQADLRTWFKHVLEVKPEIQVDWAEATYVTEDGQMLDEPETYTYTEDEVGIKPIDAKEFEGYECIEPESTYEGTGTCLVKGDNI